MKSMRAISYPQGSLERTACGAWCDILGRDVGISDEKAQIWKKNSKTSFPGPMQKSGKGEFGKGCRGNSGRALMAKGSKTQLQQ